MFHFCTLSDSDYLTVGLHFIDPSESNRVIKE
jgi:hypothetical protein